MSKADANQSRKELTGHLVDLLRDAEREGVVAEVIASFDDWGSARSREHSITSSETFLDRADRLDNRGHTDSALDLLFDQIDEMLLAGDFSRVDKLLLETAPENLSANLLIGLLTVTLPAKDRLPNRKYFLERVESCLQERGELESGLLVGLD